ncbi:MAG TPA: hypothetical protein VHY35_11075 [Stellaceae bacterium]|jgi:hypothetical protein|nr:hypothetical protein [Stellaceae bacterium]
MMQTARGWAAPRWDQIVPSWPFIVGLAMFGRLLVEKRALLNDPDTYLHIAAGRWILAHWALPVHDPFSHTMPGAVWISSEWLAQAAFAAVYDATGWSGVVLLSITVIAIAIGLMMRFLLRQLPPLPALIATIAAAALLLPHMLVRPHVLALPLLVVWTGSIIGARDAGRPPPFLVLPIMAVWTNVHGSFLVGIALAAYAVCEAVWQPRPGRTRTAEALSWGAFALAALLAALVTPNGLAGLIQPIRLVRMPALQSIFVEWMSPNFQQSPALDMWMLGLVFVGFSTGVRLPLPRLALVVGLVHMTLQHARHGDVLAIVAPLALALPLASALRDLTAAQPPSRLLAWTTRLDRPASVPAVVVTAVIALIAALPTALYPIVRTDDAVTPGAALAAAQRLGLTGPVYNSEAFGGYLIFRGVPSFIDGRVEMYGNDVIAKDYAAEEGSEAALHELLQQHPVTWALLLPNIGAAAVFARLPDWKKVYADDRAVVFARTEPSAGQERPRSP